MNSALRRLVPLGLLALAACGGHSPAAGGLEPFPAARPFTTPSGNPPVSIEHAYAIASGAGPFVAAGNLLWYADDGGTGGATSAIDSFDTATGKIRGWKTHGRYTIVQMVPGGASVYFVAQGKAGPLFGIVSAAGAISTYDVPAPANGYATGVARTSGGAVYALTYTVTGASTAPVYTNYLSEYDGAKHRLLPAKVTGISSPVVLERGEAVGTTLYAFAQASLVSLSPTGAATVLPTPSPPGATAGNLEFTPVLFQNGGNLWTALQTYPPGGGATTPFLANYSPSSKTWRYVAAGTNSNGEGISGLTAASKGTYWFTTTLASAAVGELTSGPTITSYSIPSQYHGFTGPIVRIGANLWFEETSVAKGSTFSSYLLEFKE